MEVPNPVIYFVSSLVVVHLLVVAFWIRKALQKPETKTFDTKKNY